MHGMKLALIDISAHNLSSAKESLGTDPLTETYSVDVSKIEEWRELKSKVEKSFGGVDFLMLNAGIGPKGGWEDVEYFHKIMDTNLFGVINGISTFLPVIQASKEETAIVITGSKQGITNPP